MYVIIWREPLGNPSPSSASVPRTRMFEGQFKSRSVVSLRGATRAPQSREEILRRAEQVCHSILLGAFLLTTVGLGSACAGGGSDQERSRFADHTLGALPPCIPAVSKTCTWAVR